MGTSWQSQSGQLTYRWTAIGYDAEFNLQLTRKNPVMQSGYLPELPDFASHSPFGNPASWFAPHLRPFV